MSIICNTCLLEHNISLFLKSHKKVKYLQGAQLECPKFQLYKRLLMSSAQGDAQTYASHICQMVIEHQWESVLLTRKIKCLMPHLRLVQFLIKCTRFANWYTNMVGQLAKVELSTYSYLFISTNVCFIFALF